MITFKQFLESEDDLATMEKAYQEDRFGQLAQKIKEEPNVRSVKIITLKNHKRSIKVQGLLYQTRIADLAKELDINVKIRGGVPPPSSNPDSNGDYLNISIDE